MQNIVVIVAGGSGNRMGTVVPKQFLDLNGEPVLMHTIRKFYDFDHKIKIILVLPLQQISYWKSLCDKNNFKIDHEIVSGGNSRFHSVKNGLTKVAGSSIVGIHDGVRPFVSIETIKNCYTAARKYGNAVPVVPVNESVRIKESDQNQSFDRSKLFLVQTPQVFHSDVVSNSFNQEFHESFTDDANVVESAGYKIHLVDGNRENIKITTQTDMIIAKALINL